MAPRPRCSHLTLVAAAALGWGCTINNPAFVQEMSRGDGGDAALPGDATAPDMPAPDRPIDAALPDAPVPPADGPPADLPPPDAAAPDLPIAETGPGPAEAGPPETGTPEAGPPDAGPPDLASDAPLSFPGQLRYTFESGLQGWQDLRVLPGAPSYTGLRRADFRVEGAHSLAMDVNTTAANTKPIVGVTGATGALKPPPGTVVHFRIFVPATDTLIGVQPFVLYYRSSDGTDPTGWCCGLVLAEDLVAGWNALTLTVPSTDINQRGVLELGIEFQTRGPQQFTAYVDAISW